MLAILEAMEFSPKTRLLVVAAHPDDEVLGCGGTLSRAVSAGAQVSVLFLGEGISARFPVGQYDSPEFKKQTELRTQGAKDALATLGIKDYIFGTRLCGQFDTYPIISIVKEIEAKMETFRPDILLTHDFNEVNIDHKITFSAVEIACRPTRPSTPREIYAFEIVCSGRWTFEGSTFFPNVYVDVKDHWDKKMKAWHQYEGESRSFPFPRSDMGLATLSQYRGMHVGAEKVEAFRLIRKLV